MRFDSSGLSQDLERLERSLHTAFQEFTKKGNDILQRSRYFGPTSRSLAKLDLLPALKADKNITDYKKAKKAELCRIIRESGPDVAKEVYRHVREYRDKMYRLIFDALGISSDQTDINILLEQYYQWRKEKMMSFI